jgi:hypothetical protein
VIAIHRCNHHRLDGCCINKGNDSKSIFKSCSLQRKRNRSGYTKAVGMEKLECPRCKRTGKVKAKGSGATITCPLCMGLGEIPPLHAIVENETSLALYYWECSCEIKKFGMTLRYVHPANHEVCEKCGAIAKDAPPPLLDTPRRSTRYSTTWTWTLNTSRIKPIE